MQRRQADFCTNKRTHGFSLIELVIVIVIIGVIGAIAIPRMTQGANNAGSSALKGDLQVLRQAIELYRAEHEGSFPTQTDFVSQMTEKTNLAGTTVSTQGALDYGPYLADVPEVPVGPNKGATAVAATAADATATDGWVYNENGNHVMKPHTDSATDQDGTSYNAY